MALNEKGLFNLEPMDLTIQPSLGFIAMGTASLSMLEPCLHSLGDSRQVVVFSLTLRLPLCIHNHMSLGIGTQGTQNTECKTVLFGDSSDALDHLVLVRVWTSKHTSWPPKRPWT